MSKHLDGLTEIQPSSAKDAFIRPGTQQVLFKIEPKLNYTEAVARYAGAISAVLRNESPSTWVQFVIKQARGSEIQQKFALNNSEVADLLRLHVDRCEPLKENREKKTEGCWGLADAQKESDEAYEEFQKALGEVGTRRQ